MQPLPCWRWLSQPVLRQTARPLAQPQARTFRAFGGRPPTAPKSSSWAGAICPTTPAGKAAYDKNIAALKSGELIDAARRFCVPDGIPRILATPYPFEIIQTPGQTTIIYELNHAIRVVTMDKPLPKDEELIPYPYYDGHSVGRWDGDTLVLETAGFNDKTFLDATAAPHSDAMKTVERLRKTGANQLEDVVTVHDPGHVHAGLERALRLQSAQRHKASGLCLRREAPRHFLGARRPGPLRRIREMEGPARELGAGPFCLSAQARRFMMGL